jgi:CheY-like chemotaxis protein
MLSRRLGRLGYEVIAARDGDEAVPAAERHRPDLILMDLGLPCVNGWQATRRLKRDPRTRHIPVIALTARTSQDDVLRAHRAGCDAFEGKPVMVVRLVQKIEALFQDGRDRKQWPQP